MPKMYLFTLRKPDGTQVYVLRPLDGKGEDQIIGTITESDEAVPEASADNVVEVAVNGDHTGESAPECLEEAEEKKVNSTMNNEHMYAKAEEANVVSGDQMITLLDPNGHFLGDTIDTSEMSVDDPEAISADASSGADSDCGETDNETNKLQGNNIRAGVSKRSENIRPSSSVQAVAGTARMSFKTTGTESTRVGPRDSLIARRGYFEIPRKTWIPYLPTEGITLKIGWTKVLLRAYATKNPYCKLVIKRGRVKPHPVRRTREKAIFRADAMCKEPGCIRVVISLKDLTDDETLKFDFEVIGNLSHGAVPESRHGIAPESRVDNLDQETPEAVTNNVSSDSMPVEQDGDPDSGEPKKKKKNKSSPGMWFGFAHMLGAEDNCIRILCRSPFTIAWHTKDQMEYLSTCKNPILHLGYTGQFLFTIFQEPAYYYAIVVSEEGRPEIPISEMITTCQSATNIKFWLSTVNDCLKAEASIDISTLKMKIVIDGSRILRNSALSSFFSIDTAYHLGQIMDSQENSCPALRICFVSEIHAVMEAITKLLHTSEGRNAAIRVFCALQKCTSLDEALTIYKWAFIVFNQRYVTQNVYTAIVNLESAVLRLVGDVVTVPEPHTHTQHLIDEPAEELYEKSPYYHIFLHSQSKIVQSFGDFKDRNELYIPGFTDYLLRNHLAVFPLWSQILPSGRNSCEDESSCGIEKWFHFVKVDKNKNRKHVQTFTFVRTQMQIVSSMIKDIQETMPTDVEPVEKKVFDQ